MPNITLDVGAPAKPIVRLAIAPNDPQAREREAAGLPLILPEIIHAMIDTGAGLTLIDRSLVDTLELVPTDVTEVIGATGDPVECPLYDVRLEFVQPERRLIAGSVRVAAANLAPLKVDALFGRDLLSRCVLVYNGPQGQFIFSY